MILTDRRRPERTCIGCRQQRPQDELLRVVASVDGRLTVGRSAPGRGAWLCADGACTQRATTNKAFQRAFRRPVDDAVLHAQLAPLVTVNAGAAAGAER